MDKLNRARDIIIKMIAKYPRTVREAQLKLEKHEFDPETIEKTISLLKEREILSDNQYALAWLSSELRFRPAGRNIFRKKMMKRGLKPELIEKTLSENYSENEESKTACELAKKKVISLRNGKNKAQKTARYLSQKGFNEGMIWQILSDLKLID